VADRVIDVDLVGRDRSLSTTLDKAGRSAEKSADRIDKAGKKSEKAGIRQGKAWQKTGEMMKTGGLVAGAAVLKLGYDSVKAAGESQESIGATQTVFGKYANSIISKSKNERDSIRLTANEYRNSANLIGATLKNQGVSADKLAGETKLMIQTGADLAATFGGSTKEAVEALGSAFKGEFDPIERYGIGLSAAKISTEAFRIAGVKTQAGFNKLSTSAQAAAKGQATMNIVMKQAGPALGAASRESGNLSAKIEAMKERWGNLSATLGEKLIPVVTRVLDKGIKLLAWLEKNPAAAQTAAVAVGALAAGFVVLGAAMLANPVSLITVGLVLLGAALVKAYQKSEKFRAVTIMVFKGVANVVLGAVSIYIGAFEKLFGVLGHLPGSAGKAFRSAASSARNAKAKVDGLRQSINNIHGKSVNVSVTTTFYQKGKGPGTRGQGLGVLAPRATGGPVSTGTTYMVGENGPELFTAPFKGSIIPHQGTIKEALRERLKRSGVIKPTKRKTKVQRAAGAAHKMASNNVRAGSGGGSGGGGGGGGGNTYLTINFNGRPLVSDREIKATVIHALRHAPAGGAKIPKRVIEK
jgi:hypothetical protein